ncbi:hypothetical protein LguiB_004102 [Lonicera macranthoides]
MMSGISHNSDPSEPTIDLDDLINQLTPDVQQQPVGMEGTRTQLQSSNSNTLSKLNIGAVNLDGNFYQDVANKPLQHQQFQQQQLLRKDQQPYIRPSLLQFNIPHGHQKHHHQMPPSQFQSLPLSQLQHQMQLQSGLQSQPPGLQTTMFDKQHQQHQHHQPLNQLNYLASSYPLPLGPQNHEFGSQRDMLQRHQMSASLFHPHSTMVDGCQKTVEQLQPVVLNSSSATGVASQVQNASVADWYNEAYQQIQLMKEMYLPQLLIVYKKAQESCLQQSSGELATKSQKTRGVLENIIKFLHIARPKIVHIAREKLLNHMKMVKSHLSKINNSVSLQSKTPQLQLNRNAGSLFNPLHQSSAFAHIGTPPNSQANSANSHQNGSLVEPGIRNHPSLLLHGSAGQQYTSSLLQQTNEMAPIKQSTWMPRGRSVKNASQSTWSPPPKPNSSPRIFVDASDPKMTTSLMMSPHSIPSNQMMHPEETKQSVPFGSSSLSSSPLISPSPSNPSTPPIEPAGPEKNPSGISSLSIVGPEENPETARNMEGSQQSHATEQPIQRLLNAVKSISPAALTASCKDIESVVSMIDEVPLGGTIFDIQCENSANSEGERRKRTCVMPLDDSLRLSCLQFDRSTATSKIKRPKIEASSTLLEEIKDINRNLVETTLEVDSNSADNISRAGVVLGTIVRCSYSGIGFAELFKLHLNSPLMLPNLFVRLLVPDDYPNSSPKVFDELSDGLSTLVSENPEDLIENVKVAFGLSLRKLPQPVSLREMARTWDVCARAVFTEFANGMRGKSYSSRYGNWESCITAP